MRSKYFNLNKKNMSKLKQAPNKHKLEPLKVDTW